VAGPDSLRASGGVSTTIHGGGACRPDSGVRELLWVSKNGFAGLTSPAGHVKRVIAMVNEFAMGGGFEIALACHLIVADATARFALSEVKVSLGAGGVVRLPRTIPPKVPGDDPHRPTDHRGEVLDYGLINRVVEAGRALKGARDLAARVLDGSPTSVTLPAADGADAADRRYCRGRDAPLNGVRRTHGRSGRHGRHGRLGPEA
jgi:hypothetical protein